MHLRHEKRSKFPHRVDSTGQEEGESVSLRVAASSGWREEDGKSNERRPNTGRKLSLAADTAVVGVRCASVNYRCAKCVQDPVFVLSVRMYAVIMRPLCNGL